MLLQAVAGGRGTGSSRAGEETVDAAEGVVISVYAWLLLEAPCTIHTEQIFV